MNIKRLYFSSLITAVLMAALAGPALAQQDRAAIADKYKWDLSPLFKSDEAWKSAKDKLVTLLPGIDGFKGKLTMNAKELFNCLDYLSTIEKEASRLYAYSGMSSDLDTRDMKYSSMTKELQQIFSEFSAKASFVDPEILTMDWQKIEQFIRDEPKLEIYRKPLKDLFREKAHTLTQGEERIMALSGLVSGVASSTFNTFNNAEMPAPEVTLSDGKKVLLTSAGYDLYRSLPDRTDREMVFRAFWNNYRKFEASYGEMLYGSIMGDIFAFKARNYSSSLESALYPYNIPVGVYHSLIDNVNKNLPAFYRYLEIKKKMLKVDTLKYSDLYAPVVKDINLKYSYEEARQIVLRALAPLGPEYISVVKKALDERWIDVFPTTAKNSGAYSNDAAYNVHPYILMNYNNLYSDVSTLAHEMGHTMHSYFAQKAQPYPTASYSTFVAEVASTFNEVLLFREIMKEVKDDDTRLSLLMSWLDQFKGTLFRQTQFAEFELMTHEAAEKGQALTGKFLSELYRDEVRKYYGHNKGVCFVDDYVSLEWAFIPHFYSRFYVYQYSTSFTASISLAEKVLNNEKGALENYLRFLSSGGSDYPIELLKKAGVDMTTSEPFDKTIAAMNSIMDEIDKILARK